MKRINIRIVISLLSSLLVVVGNVLIGHYFAPNGICLTPFVLIIITSLIVFAAKQMKLIYQSSIVISFVILHDVGIKLYAGGTYDLEGLGWILLFLIIGLIFSYSIVLYVILKNKNYSRKDKLIAALIYPLAIIIYQIIFFDLCLEA